MHINNMEGEVSLEDNTEKLSFLFSIDLQAGRTLSFKEIPPLIKVYGKWQIRDIHLKIIPRFAPCIEHLLVQLRLRELIPTSTHPPHEPKPTANVLSFLNYLPSVRFYFMGLTTLVSLAVILLKSKLTPANCTEMD